MRSRFSAYAKGDYQYIFKTYGALQRAKLSETDLAEQADNTTWLSLQVLQHIQNDNKSQVEFKAYYKLRKRIFVMHERSNFEYCDGRWFYTTGVMLDGTKELTLKRNDLCFCGSNKKYKKCCGP
jgi:SEC-C motif-containing protein